MQIQIAKIGGSLITDKTRPETLEEQTLTRLCREIAACTKSGRGEGDAYLPLILGHGSGSYGHHAAAQGGLRSVDHANASSVPEVTPLDVARVQEAAHRLHRAVIARLVEAGVPAFSFPASSWLSVGADGGLVVESLEPMMRALDHSMVPVVCGDVVLTRTRERARIASTERVLAAIVERLPENFRVGRGLWLGRTDGLLDADGRAIDQVCEGNLGRAQQLAGYAEGTDVTGGMSHRLSVLWDLSERVGVQWILDGTRPQVFCQGLQGHRMGGTEVVRP